MPVPILAPILAAVGAWIGRLMFSKLGAWLLAALIFLGIELVAYSVALQPLRAGAENALFDIPESIRQWMGVLRLDQYVTIILSAYIAGAVKRALIRRRTS